MEDPDWYCHGKTEQQIFLKRLSSEAFSELMKFCNNVEFNKQPIVDLALTLKSNFLEPEEEFQVPEKKKKWEHLCESCNYIFVSKSRWDSGKHICFQCSEAKKIEAKNATWPRCARKGCKVKLAMKNGKQRTRSKFCVYCRVEKKQKRIPLRIAG